MEHSMKKNRENKMEKPKPPKLVYITEGEDPRKKKGRVWAKKRKRKNKTRAG